MMSNTLYTHYAFQRTYTGMERINSVWMILSHHYNPFHLLCGTFFWLPDTCKKSQIIFLPACSLFNNCRQYLLHAGDRCHEMLLQTKKLRKDEKGTYWMNVCLMDTHMTARLFFHQQPQLLLHYCVLLVALFFVPEATESGYYCTTYSGLLFKNSNIVQDKHDRQKCIKLLTSILPSTT